MRTVLLIGVGAGDPEHVTVQAIKALNRTDAFFLIDKGSEKDDLAELRRQVCDRHIEPGRNPRFVQARDPERDRTRRDGTQYRATIEQWHSDRTDIYQRMVTEELADGETGAFLVWGDPALYDGTLRILDRLAQRGIRFETEVIPGISSISALTAAHRIPLNRIGEAIHITTGRRLSEQLTHGRLPEGLDNIVVMLDGDLTFTMLKDPGVQIFWGAYLGTDDQVIITGPVLEVAEQIKEVRAEARARKGWIMDTYLLRR